MPLVDLFPLFVSYKMVLFFLEEDIEGGEAAIDACDVLLKVYFFFVAKIFIAINILFQHPKPVSCHNYFMKKNFNRNFFWLQ